MPRNSRPTSLLFRAAALAWTMAVAVSCDAPVKVPAPEAPQDETPSASIVPPAEPETPAAPPKPAPESPTAVPEPTIPAGPILEVREEGQKITISGWISSRYQAADIVKGIANRFPDAEVVTTLRTAPSIPEVRWGNRVLDLIAPLLEMATDARFFYEDGVTHVEGTVESAALIFQFQELTAAVMSDSDARDIDNRLKTPDGTTIHSKNASPKSNPGKPPQTDPTAPPN